jgi:DNA repair exonuclease SbcCD ATPase subunit
MQASISHIFLFKDNEETRTLNFDDGLNIISGDSKTGKSAVIEILDYCLFASRSTIPKGIITDWTDLYCIIFKVKDKHLIIGRRKNSNQMYFSVEINSDFLTCFSIEYFSEKKLIDLDEAKREFEKHIGISVLDTRVDEEEDKRKSGGKATMRSFVPFLFQHQNLIANKHSLFYRFDDFYKRKKTIDDYPILMGWGNADFFDLQRNLESKQKELSQKKKLVEKLKISNGQLRDDLYGVLSFYFTFLGKELSDDINLPDLKKLVTDLPNSNANSVGDQNLNEELRKIDNLIFEKKKELDTVQNLLSTIESNNDISKNYSKNINRLKSLASIETNVSGIHCPLCDQEVEAIKEKIAVIQESNEILEDEFVKIGTYVNDTSAQNASLRKERDDLKKELKELNIKAESLNKQILTEFNTKNEYEKGLLLKGRTEANAQNLIERNKLLSNSRSDYSELEAEIEVLKNKLAGFNLKEELQKAQIILSEKMSAICELLDFEEEFKPGLILFDLEKFSLKYNVKDKENILLSEMGSGSNWLAIHLSTFIGFLYLHSITTTSKIPSILVLDQPSQVYFPKVYKQLDEEVENVQKKVDDNIFQVKNIFKVISDEIINIHNECGYKPQVIVLEHADEDEFDKFVKYRWSKNGEKLI